ncbi:lactate/malate family dehydrogenase [Alloiococcus sp. CFN-8]|uniref:lactate/malate family dehydrogenase n=1 Tax=Alloiococcus sp. CFN-8 TaxID=3416081 RepID=UPI003CFB0EE3
MNNNKETYKILYKVNDHLLLTDKFYKNLETESIHKLKDYKGILLLDIDASPEKTRSYFKIDTEDVLQGYKEDVSLLWDTSLPSYPTILKDALQEGRLYGINSSYPDFKNFPQEIIKTKNLKVNIVGLGDVGGILATGLKLLSNETISSIGLYDTSPDKVSRWEQELSSIFDMSSPISPKVYSLKEEELFDCDAFIFCVSVGVPTLGSEVNDVRMAQFQGNKKVISLYGKKAREAAFKGMFFVVSDPVDLLCKAVFIESNKNEEGELDFRGIPSHRIKGFGLGVMNARAAYIASKEYPELDYINEGRVYGPHGEGLIVANSLKSYNNEASLFLTDMTKNANLKVRETGFKPYIAPALSSGALSILSALRGEPHYSSSFLGGIYMGARNSIIAGATIFEKDSMPHMLKERLKDTEEYLQALY